MRTVVVVYHREDVGWWADSPDVDGFVAGDESLDETRRLVHEGLSFYLDDPDVEFDERFDPPVTRLDVQAPEGVGVSSPEARERYAQPVLTSPPVDFGVINAA